MVLQTVVQQRASGRRDSAPDANETRPSTEIAGLVWLRVPVSVLNLTFVP